MASLDRTARQIFFVEFIKSFALTMRYFFSPKVTLNYPFEKGPLSPRFTALMMSINPSWSAGVTSETP